MSIRTQVQCFVLFPAILLASVLVHGLVQGQLTQGREARSQAPAAPATPNPATPNRAVQPATDASRFYTTVSERFQVRPQQVRQLVDAGLPPGQVVVVYYLAEHSLRQPAQILADRQAGKSWRDIAVASGLETESFYQPIARPRAPFVNVYALYHQQSREGRSWSQLPLRDADVEDLVNLRFLASLGGRSVPEIMRLRAQGHDVVSIHHFLLAGQKTARLESVAAAADVRA